MTTLDDMLEYKLGDKVVLLEAPGQNPKNSFKTGTDGKISEFYADGFLVKTNYGECIRTYLPFVCRKEEDKMTEVRTYAVNTFSDTDKIIKDLKERGYKIIATSTDIKHKAFTVVFDKE